MKTTIMMLAALAIIGHSAQATAQTSDAPDIEPTTSTEATKEGNETSDRTPKAETKTPESQVDTTEEGETSDRTPSNHDDDANQ